jgi:hypothetical protein
MRFVDGIFENKVDVAGAQSSCYSLPELHWVCWIQEIFISLDDGNRFVLDERISRTAIGWRIKVGSVQDIRLQSPLQVLNWEMDVKKG